MTKHTVLPKGAYHFVWAPIGALLLAEVLLGLFSPRDLGPLTYVSDSLSPSPDIVRYVDSMAPARWHEASLRLRFLALALVSTVFSIMVLGKFTHDLRQYFTRPAREHVLAIYALGLGLGVVAFIMLAGGVLVEARAVFGAEVFDNALDDRFGASPFQRWWGPTAFEWIKRLTQLISTAAIPAFVAGGVSCLARFGGLDDCENWEFQSERLRTYVYLSGGLLVLGVLFLESWTTYPIYLFEPDDRSVFKDAVRAYAMYTGVEFSLVLAAYAVPVALVLSRRADQIARKVVTERRAAEEAEGWRPTRADIRKFRAENGLFVSGQDMLKSLLALIAPFVTGSVASLASFA